MNFDRGYTEIRDRINKYPQFNKSCFNCKYFYLKKGDDEELCHNTNVLEYDICYDEKINRIYCGFWGGIKDESEAINGRKEISNNKDTTGIFRRHKNTRI